MAFFSGQLNRISEIVPVRGKANELCGAHVDNEALFARNGNLEVRGVIALDDSLNVERDAARQTLAAFCVG